jgi:hypothetical protein
MKNIAELKQEMEKIKLNNQNQIENKYNLLRNISTKDWQPIHSSHAKKLDHHHVYVRYTNTQNLNSLTIYIGKDISDLLEYKISQKVGILTSLTSPNLFLIVKNPSGIGTYTISSTNKTEIKHLCFPVKKILNFPKSQSLPVEFDISQNYELIIDINKIITY